MEWLLVGALIGVLASVGYGLATEKGTVMDPILRVVLIIALIVWTILNVILILNSV